MIHYDDFIARYEHLYFIPESIPTDKYNLADSEETPSVIIKNPTHYLAEEAVMKKLKACSYDDVALAWKAGLADWDETRGELKFPGFKTDEGYQIGYYKKRIAYGEFEDYCKWLNNKSGEISQNINDGNWKNAYIIACPKEKLKYFGPINVINAMFFVSGGKAPIYDQYAHKAIRALALDMSPNDVYLGVNPDRNATKAVITMYSEYMILLQKVFPKKTNTFGKGPFIRRELDRALWVYGHATQKYTPG